MKDNNRNLKVIKKSGTMLHRAVIRIARIVYEPYLKYKFKYDYEKVNYTKGNFIALANHTTNMDSMLVGVAFKQHMYFVAAEHLYRMGILSWLLRTFVSIIKRNKTKTEVRTAANILRALREGNNVCMFPEGSSTWNGETSTIIESTAKLVKRAKVTLITYKVEGGHPTMPRWGKGIRPGKMIGSVAGIYEPEQLDKMSVEQIYDQLKSDLYVNSEDITKEYEYKSKHIAQDLEALIFVCPACEGISTYSSDKDKFTCSCGVSLKLDSHYNLINIGSIDFPFTRIIDWDKWQRNWVLENTALLKQDKEKIITSDENQNLYSFTDDGKTSFILNGTMSLYSDRLEFLSKDNMTTVVVMLNEMSDIAIITKTRLMFSHKDIHYEVKCNFPRSALKYLILCSSLYPMRYII